MAGIEEIKETDTQRIDKFHKHLDVCSQCRNNPFGLCCAGAKLLKYAATGIKEQSNDGTD